MVPQGNHCGKLANEIMFYIWGLVYHSKWNKSQYDVIVIEEYLIVTCNFIERKLVSLASCIFMKIRFCQSNWQRYVWSVTEESTVVADDAWGIDSECIEVNLFFPFKGLLTENGVFNSKMKKFFYHLIKITNKNFVL